MAGAGHPDRLGLAVMVELHSVLRERQNALEDAAFQLRALRQVARLLSSVHSAEETENLILDFMTEVFFAWWACLYRPQGDAYIPKVFRSLKGPMALTPIDLAALDKALPERDSRAERGRCRAGAPAASQYPARRHAGCRRRTAGGPGAGPAAARTGLRRTGIRAGWHPRLRRGDRAQERPPRRAAAERRHHRSAHLSSATGARWKSGSTPSCRGAAGTRCTPASCWWTSTASNWSTTPWATPPGDRLLVLIAQILRQQCRTLDAVGRMGGDEFLVILPDDHRGGGHGVHYPGAGQRGGSGAEPSRNSAAPHSAWASPRRHATARRPSTLLAAADSALYRAKRGGRNAVEIAEDTVAWRIPSSSCWATRCGWTSRTPLRSFRIATIIFPTRRHTSLEPRRSS